MMEKLNAEEVNDQSIRDLAAAICIQAAVDYRKSLLGKWGGAIGGHGKHIEYGPFPGGKMFLLRGRTGWHPASQDGIDPPEEYEKFFKSEWFVLMSGLEDSQKVIMFLRSVRGRHVHCGKEWLAR